ncbi:MAG: Crp/Fnr family transcriptional regulator [Eubacteriales bacterium]
MEKLIYQLRKCELFGEISEGETESLLICLEVSKKSFEKKQIVFAEGERSDSFGIVLSGQVQVKKIDFYGNRNILAMIGEGGLFGETFAFSKQKTLPFSVSCANDCEALFVDHHKLASMCAKACPYHNTLILNMLGIIADKNIFLNERLELVAKRTTKEKLLAFLYAESKRAGSSCFAINLNRQELADYLSVERSAMSAEISKLRNEGIIKSDKNNFCLLKKSEPFGL